KAMSKMKVVLEARIDNGEAEANPLPERFTIPISGAAGGNLISGTKGWIPLPALSARAHDIGFVDYRTLDRMPLVERYDGRCVKSLFTCCIEVAMGHAAITPGKSLQVGEKTLAMDEDGQAKV